ncbi:MAG: ATP-binding protein [Candidatus Bipolaricaulota bacterium]|nr:ATP-binding protein [Candidatus Bipolaricaulota bacterium]MBS3792814.1 ATP-binding protein [Candidatus Bipolaricaulota bacterium]
MKQILVISGKGGTGKTTLVSSFASLAGGKVLSDCDVDAADLHLVLSPRVNRKEEFSGGKEAVKDSSKCTECGLCYEGCRFDAIDENYEIDHFRCEGCGVCAYVCPEGAITMEDVLSGYSLESSTEHGSMIHGELQAGEEASGKLVTEIKQKAKKLAEEEGQELVIIDGSPGTGCPVIASLADVDFALVVTEPTESGLSDLKRVVELSKNFEVEPAIVVNKHDLNHQKVSEIEKYAEGHDIPIIGRIPYDSNVTRAMVEGESIVEYSDDGASEAIREIWRKVENKLLEL